MYREVDQRGRSSDPSATDGTVCQLTLTTQAPSTADGTLTAGTGWLNRCAAAAGTTVVYRRRRTSRRAIVTLLALVRQMLHRIFMGADVPTGKFRSAGGSRCQR